jgi:hypothetical protein
MKLNAKRSSCWTDLLWLYRGTGPRLLATEKSHGFRAVSRPVKRGWCPKFLFPFLDLRTFRLGDQTQGHLVVIYAKELKIACSTAVNHVDLTDDASCLGQHL